MQHGVRYVFRASRSRRFSGDIAPGRIGTTTDDTSGADVALDAHLGWTLYRVLDGLRFPGATPARPRAGRRLGVGGSLRLWLTDLPEGSYAGVHTVVAEIRRSRRTSTSVVAGPQASRRLGPAPPSVAGRDLRPGRGGPSAGARTAGSGPAWGTREGAR